MSARQAEQIDAQIKALSAEIDRLRDVAAALIPRAAAVNAIWQEAYQRGQEGPRAAVPGRARLGVVRGSGQGES